jgi:uncharacterized repeat protein (TIGR02543 family)
VRPRALLPWLALACAIGVALSLGFHTTGRAATPPKRISGVNPILTVTVTGGGSVTDDTGRISCPPTCQAEYPPPVGGFATAHLTAHGTTDAIFTGWGGDCTGTNPSCDVLMNADKSVSATFTSPTPTPTPSPTPTPTPSPTPTPTPTPTPHPGRKLPVTFYARWAVSRSWTRVVSLRVLKTPAGATVHLTCLHGGKGGCAFKVKTIHVKAAGTVVLTGYFKHRRLHPGAKIRVSVTKTGYIGKGVLYTIRAHKKPSVTNF